MFKFERILRSVDGRRTLGNIVFDIELSARVFPGIHKKT